MQKVMKILLVKQMQIDKEKEMKHQLQGDDDQESEVGAHLPMNQNQSSMNGDDGQSQQTGQTGLSLQIGVDNIGNQLNGRQQNESEANGNGNENGNGNNGSNGNGNGDENGDLSNGQGSNGNGNDNNQIIVAASSGIGDKAEIEDEQLFIICTKFHKFPKPSDYSFFNLPKSINFA